MSSARKPFHLSQRECLHLIEALALLSCVRLGLTLLRYHRLSRLLDRSQRGRSLRAPLAFDHVEQLARAVSRGSRLVPGASCLTQALTGQLLLARRGIESTVHLGVSKDTHQQFRAHAWLSVGDRVVLGGGGMERFTPLTTLARQREPAP